MKAFKCIIYDNFISASNNICISKKKLLQKLYTSQTIKTNFSYNFLICFNRFVSRMGSHITRTLYVLHATLF